MLFGRQPAFWIGLIVTLVAGILTTLTGEGVISDAIAGRALEAVNAIAGVAVLLAPLIAGLLIRGEVTPVAAPTLPSGTAVTVEGTDKTVTVA